MSSRVTHEVAGAPRMPPGTIRRDRLLAVLDEPAALVVLRGTGGIGKTTLMAQWAEAAVALGAARVWVGREAGIRSRSAFWTHVLTRLREHGLIADDVYHRESAAVAAGGESARHAAERTFATIDGPVVLLLDSIGDPAAGTFWDDVGADLVAVLRAGGVRCVVTTRFPTVLETPYARSEVTVRVVLDDELALDDEEVRAIARADAPRLDAAGLDALARHPSSQHPLSLRYTLSLLDRSSGAPVRIADLDVALRDAVRRDLLARVRDPAVLDFLGATAQSPAVDVPLAIRLSGREDAEALLNEFERGGAGQWSRRGDAPAVFTYADHLRAAAAADYAQRHPSRLGPMHAETARWLDAHGDRLAAFEYAVRARDLDYAIDVLLRSYPMPREDDLRISELLRTVPAVDLHRHPLLALRFAVVLNKEAATQKKANEFFASAALVGRLLSSSTPPLRRAIQLGLESAAWRLTGQQRRMRDTALRALDLLEIIADGERDRVFDGSMLIAVRQCAMGLLYAGEFERAVDANLLHARIAEERGWRHETNVARAGIALVHAVSGRHRQARAALDLIRDEDWPEPWRDSYQDTPMHIARAWLLLSDGDPQGAIDALAGVAAHLDTIEHWEFILTPQSLAEALLGHAREAEQRFGRLARETTGRRTLPFVRGRVAETRQLLGIAAGLASPAPSRRDAAHESAMSAAVRAILDAGAGRTEPALGALASAERGARTPLHELAAAVAGVVVAVVVDGLDIVAYGARMSAIVREEGLRWPLALVPPAARTRVIAALGEAGELRARELLDAGFATVGALGPGDAPHRSVPSLTPRERDVLLALADTASRAEIAGRLFISVNTVKTQLRSVYGKLEASSREEVLARALSLGLLQDAHDDADAGA